MITLYDLANNVPIKSASFNSWKARYSLNYKGLAYQTKGLEFLEIEPLFKEFGIPPTATKPDGSPLYTVPAIYDDATGAKVAESLNIAEYLDKTYPTAGRDLIPPGTIVFQRTFIDAFLDAITPILPQLAARVPGILSTPSSQEYYRSTRAPLFGVKDLKELLPVGAEERSASLKKFEAGLAKVDGWLTPIGDLPFIGGAHPVFADFVIGSAMLCFMHILGKNSEEWKAISSWHGGRWGKIADNLSEFGAVV